LSSVDSFWVTETVAHFDAVFWFFCYSNAAFTPSILAQKRRFFANVFNGLRQLGSDIG